MSPKTIAMLKSWAGTFISAVLASLTAVLVATGNLSIDWITIQAVLYSGVIAVLPVVRNYFDTQYLGYGQAKSE